MEGIFVKTLQTKSMMNFSRKTRLLKLRDTLLNIIIDLVPLPNNSPTVSIPREFCRVKLLS